MGRQEGAHGDDGEGLDDALAGEAVCHLLYGRESGPRVVGVGRNVSSGLRNAW